MTILATAIPSMFIATSSWVFAYRGIFRGGSQDDVWLPWGLVTILVGVISWVTSQGLGFLLCLAYSAPGGCRYIILHTLGHNVFLSYVCSMLVYCVFVRAWFACFFFLVSDLGPCGALWLSLGGVWIAWNGPLWWYMW